MDVELTNVGVSIATVSPNFTLIVPVFSKFTPATRVMSTTVHACWDLVQKKKNHKSTLTHTHTCKTQTHDHSHISIEHIVKNKLKYKIYVEIL